jgi:subtilisin family serine protease
MKTIKLFLVLTLFINFFYNCGGSALISTPIENIDAIPLKILELTENEKNTWGHLDLLKDTIPGMSVNKAYDEIINNKKGKATIVAVMDSGIDINHEDLDAVIWTNKGEIPNNGKDDDNNGYIDDIHGWNFLGDAYDEQLEYVRLLASGDRNNPRYAEAEAEYNKEYQKFTGYKTQYEENLQLITNADAAISKYLKKTNYTKENVNAIKTEVQKLQQSIAIINYVYSLDFETVAEAKKTFSDGLEGIDERLNIHLNKSLKGRQTGDNPNDLRDVGYGNGNVKPIKKSESHGTHVAGIIAAERNNNQGIKGVANNVQIMVIRSTPNGDEYDKDVTLGIRYAVDNGAKVINMSFGKYYSTHSDWVRDAIVYAASKDVLIISGSGNDSSNLDVKNNYPSDQIGVGQEVSDNFLSVGALEPKYGSGLIADYSNYGKNTVDVFAPGSAIYSTMPENEYEAQDGTSMAAPYVTGVAALIRSQYPNLTAAEVKHIIMDSGLSITPKLVIGGNSSDLKTLSQISKSSKIVNAYNALVKASRIKNQ